MHLIFFLPGIQPNQPARRGRSVLRVSAISRRAAPNTSLLHRVQLRAGRRGQRRHPGRPALDGSTSGEGCCERKVSRIRLKMRGKQKERC